MAKNDEHTAGNLKKLLSEKFGEENITFSERTIARAQNALGWTFSTARYGKRVLWVNKCLEDEEQFRDVVFTDECMVQLECHKRKSFLKKNAPRKVKYHHKYPHKVHVWAGDVSGHNDCDKVQRYPDSLPYPICSQSLP